MKKRLLLCINLFLVVLILSGFLTVLGINYTTHKVLMEDAIESISKLTSATIYARINDELSRPLYVSQTMASDEFLKTWLYGEEENKGDAAYLEKVEEYLLTLKNKYGYDTAYTISAYTNTYYYYDGINKVVGYNSKHDQWYYNFIESGEDYVLNIDEDEVNKGEPTVFIDSRIEDADGNLIGVTGVGVKLSQVQELLREFEEEYQLEAYLLRADGSISVHTDHAQVDKVNLFEERVQDNIEGIISDSRHTLQMTWLSDGALRNCMISRYIENLDWYLVVEKDTSDLYQSFQRMFFQDLTIAIVVLIILLILSTLGVRTYQKFLYERSRIDTLTGLHDRQYFMDTFRKQERAWTQHTSSFFMLDADYFKSINDTYGHLTGNTVLSTIGRIIREEIGPQSLAIRWGGDEFAGVLEVPDTEAVQVLENVRTKLSQVDFNMELQVTLSIGITQIKPGDTPKTMLDRADKALYMAKEQGRNCISVYNE